MNAASLSAVLAGDTGAWPSASASHTAIALPLLFLLAVVLITGTVIVLIVMRHVRFRRLPALIPERERRRSGAGGGRFPVSIVASSPCRWLAIRTRNLAAVQTALGLHNPVPCSWIEGMTRLSDWKLFISPPVNGWILVIGPHLPEPGEDIDACFRFLLRLSRELGEVQFFHTHRVVGHHAWARLEEGRVVRGYAWAGETLWNQGAKTWAERKLGLRCHEYFASEQHAALTLFEDGRANAEKVALLAALWSVDPTTINESLLTGTRGVAGDLSQARLH